MMTRLAHKARRPRRTGRTAPQADPPRGTDRTAAQADPPRRTGNGGFGVLLSVTYSLVVAGVCLTLLPYAGRLLSAPPLPPPVSVQRAVAVEPLNSPVLDRSAPVSVAIPKLQVNAPVAATGRNWLGYTQVPSLDEPHLTSWYSPGPAPGQRGPAVLYGHADTERSGPAVFHGLGDLRPGDRIRVAREDGLQAAFAVDTVEVFAKDTFPAERVYGPTSNPSLRLVTCGGRFDVDAGTYLDNIIVFATLTRGKTRAAPGA